MKILDRYLLREHVAPFLLALMVLTFILLMDRLFELINLFINKKVPLNIVAELFLLGLPNILALTVPMAVLVSSLMTFGRLAQDNEFSALRSSGISFFRMLVTPVLASMMITGLLYIFSDQVLPQANHAFKNLLMDIHQARPALKIRENHFINDFPGYHILIRRVDEARSHLHGITIYESGRGTAPRTIIASKGRLITLPDQQLIRLELSRGEIHEIDPDDPTRYHRMVFKSHTINLPLDGRFQHQARSHRSDREMTTAMLRNEVARVDSQIAALKSKLEVESNLPEWQVQQFQLDMTNYLRERSGLQVEIQKKITIPVACIIFVFLGSSLGVIVRRGGMWVSAGMSLAFFLFYWICLIGGEEMAERQLMSPALAMWLANILLGTSGLVLSLMQQYELRPRDLGPIVLRHYGGLIR